MNAPVLAAVDAVASTTPPRGPRPHRWRPGVLWGWAATVSSSAAEPAAAPALTDAVHAKTTTGGANPNRELVEELLANGVEVWVCGQSVVRGGHALAEGLPVTEHELRWRTSTPGVQGGDTMRAYDSFHPRRPVRSHS